MKSAFERQMEEAVAIEKKAKEGEILNSKCEYNQTTLPRLITRIGDKETEMKEWEKELRKEKEAEEKMEERIRLLRKNRNKERLKTEKNTQPRKKRKTEESYISIRSVWGPPPPKAPNKNKNVAEDGEKESNFKKRKVETDRLTNIRRIEDKVYTGETIEDFEIEEKRDWDKVLKDHAEKLEKEAKEKAEKIKCKEIKEKSWELYRECKKFLEENEKNWEKLKIERETEEKRKWRLQIARKQQEDTRKRIKEKKLQEEITESLKKLPDKERKELLQEEKRKRNLEIAETKRNLWKLRAKEKKYEKNNAEIEQLDKVKGLEDKLEKIKNILSLLHEEELKRIQEKAEAQEKITKEWRKKVVEKERKENERKDRLKKQEMLSKRWGMLRWVTNYINENQEDWYLSRILQEEETRLELENFKKLKRFEKIEYLKKKWSEDAQNIEGGGPPMGAFPFQKSKAPSEDIQEGDPPLGKERGTLGVGTGPTPPQKVPDPPVFTKPDVILENENNHIAQIT